MGTSSNRTGRIIAVGAALAATLGLSSRSTDGRFVIVTGYGATMPTTGLSGSASTAVPRVIGRVDANGVVDTSTALSAAATGNNPRSAASDDGSRFRFTGGACGDRFAAFGATTSTQLSTTTTNLRQSAIFDGQRFVSASSGTTRVTTVGSGLPTTAGQAISNLPGTPTTGSPYGIFAADLDATPGIDTMYVADDTPGTITKYSLVGSNWVGSAIAAAGVRGLTGTVSGSTVTLFASAGGSTATGGGTLWSIADSAGYDAAPSSTVPTSVAPAAANTASRGVALAPNATVPPLVPESPLPVSLPLAGIAAVGGWSLNRRRKTHPVTAA